VLGATAGPAGIVMDAVRTGAVFSLLQGAFYQVGNMMSGKKTPDEDLAFVHTRGMLLMLGLQRYEKNFMKGQLDDLTLPLLTDRCGAKRLLLPCYTHCISRHTDAHPARFLRRFCSALKEVKIPPGPRLRILHHVAFSRAAAARSPASPYAPQNTQSNAALGPLSLALPVAR
jgi:hypothetical protein